MLYGTVAISIFLETVIAQLIPSYLFLAELEKILGLHGPILPYQILSDNPAKSCRMPDIRPDESSSAGPTLVFTCGGHLDQPTVDNNIRVVVERILGWKFMSCIHCQELRQLAS